MYRNVRVIKCSETFPLEMRATKINGYFSILNAEVDGEILFKHADSFQRLGVLVCVGGKGTGLRLAMSCGIGIWLGGGGRKLLEKFMYDLGCRI